MRILIDTNVILDVLLKRSPFYETAIEVLKLSARDDIQEFVSASAITDIYYIAYKNLRDKAAVRELLKKLLLIVSVAGVSEEEIQKALELEWNDFEDSVQYSVAALNEMDGIITRNVKDYSSAEMQVWEPAQFLEKQSADLLTLLITLKRRCAEPSCFSRFADLNSGSIPVCGMILSERNVVKSTFLLFFFL
jgi:predicted nucleic acid-binding protein